MEPSSLTCHITGAIPEDPVLGLDGNVYERSALSRWVQQSGTCPTSRVPMTLADIREPERIIVNLCEELGGRAAVAEEKATPFTCSQGSLHALSEAGSDDSRPTDIVLVLDRSGSTGGLVAAQDENGHQIDDGLRIIDLIAHGAATVASSLDKMQGSRLGLVLFDHTAQVALPLSPPGDLKRRVDRLVGSLVPGGGTNIWAGIVEAVNMIGESQRNAHILLLTDGQPTSGPCRPMTEALQHLFMRNGCTVPIHTFGFGTALKAGLLADISRVSGGLMTGIPDGGLLGTAFCHAIGNCACSAVNSVRLEIEGNDMPDNLFAPGLHVSFPDPTRAHVMIGSIQQGQTRKLRLQIGDAVVDKARFFGDGWEGPWLPETEIAAILYSGQDPRWTVMLRLEQARKASYTAPPSLGVRASLAEGLDDDFFVNAAEQDLLRTWKDQLVPALVGGREHSYYDSWGWIYIDQVLSGLANSACTNFKDAALQSYGGRRRRLITEEASDLFDTMPAVIAGTDSCTPTRSMRSSVRRPPVSMAVYNNAGSGCFTAETRILVPGGGTIAMGEIHPGSIVLTTSGPREVIATLTTRLVGEHSLARGHGWCGSPWHPVRPLGNMTWSPVGVLRDCGPVRRTNETVHSLVIENGDHYQVRTNTGRIFEAASLGHLSREAGLVHGFWGEKVLACMEARSDYPSVAILSTELVRGADGDVKEF